MNKSAKQNSLPFPAVVVIAALAGFGVITLVSWLVGALAGILQYGLFFVIVAALAAWAVSAKGRR